MARFRAWLKKHFRSEPTAEQHPKHQLPFLPASRSPIAPPTTNTPTCLFFKLPYELREIILLMAFGGRTLHMDLVREEPDSEWQWRGALCSRKPSNLPTKPYTCFGPRGDTCLLHAYSPQGKSPTYNIGITSFLLSCKQAYHEGTHILYATNCITLSSESLLHHLPQLVPPERLSTITTLEILVRARPLEKTTNTWTFTLDHLALILNNVKAHCHHLRSFLVAFGSHSHFCDIHDRSTLPFLDAFQRAAGLRDMRVEVSRVVYCKWPDRDRDGQEERKHPREKRVTSWEEKYLWRSLDGEEPGICWRSNERYPFPPLRVPVREGDEGAESEGYWLLQGDEGPGLPFGTDM